MPLCLYLCAVPVPLPPPIYRGEGVGMGTQVRASIGYVIFALSLSQCVTLVFESYYHVFVNHNLYPSAPSYGQTATFCAILCHPSKKKLKLTFLVDVKQARARAAMYVTAFCYRPPPPPIYRGEGGISNAVTGINRELHFCALPVSVRAACFRILLSCFCQS